MIEVLEAELEHARLATDSSLYWTPDRTAVSNLTFTARRHEVTLVSGPVGSGKSSLLELDAASMAVLSESPLGVATGFTTHGEWYDGLLG